MCGICGCMEQGSEGEHGHAHGHGHVDGHAHDHDHVDGHAHDHADGGKSRGETRTMRLEADLLAKNDGIAARNRAWLSQRGIAAFNLMGTPGAGKTALLEGTLRALGSKLPALVLEGDQATDRDAQRVRAAGAKVLQINTGQGCHLDAHMIAHGVAELNPPSGSLLFIENVGNLVCPALFDLGERDKLVVMSVTEGEDKPLKYPHMFRAASVLVLNKIDLLAHVDFDVERCLENARRVNPRLRVFRLSATRGDGLDEFCAFLHDEVRAHAPAAELAR